MLPQSAHFSLLRLCMLLFITPLAVSQSNTKMDAKSRAEVEHLRSIANAIKACPRVTEWKDTGIGTIYDGPPSNVVWDVKPSDSIRAPYLGYVEFFLPREFSATKEECERSHSCRDMIETTKPFRYRFEFDLGPEVLDLTKLLVKLASDKEWSDARPDRSCWQSATFPGEKKSE
ncbi:MAG TPA: hypothetical protein VI386_19420 [Candidatus Sulfotelmatobacter sp.]